MTVVPPHTPQWESSVVDGHLAWTNTTTGDTVTGKPWAPCSDTPVDNPTGLAAHPWTRRGNLWVCTDCHRATVGRPIPVCDEREHKWSNRPGDDQDLCTRCFAHVRDLFDDRATQIGQRFM